MSLARAHLENVIPENDTRVQRRQAHRQERMNERSSLALSFSRVEFSEREWTVRSGICIRALSSGYPFCEIPQNRWESKFISTGCNDVRIQKRIELNIPRSIIYVEIGLTKSIFTFLTNKSGNHEFVQTKLS